MATVIALANQKGGVAKTTTCLNLGAGLAARGIRTLLIDADPQGSLSRYLGQSSTSNDSFSPLGEWILDRKPFREIVLNTKWDNLSFVPSNEKLIGAESTISTDTIKAIHYLGLKVKEIRQDFDVVLIDTMPSFSHLFTNALMASDKVLIPVKLEWLSFQGLAPLLSKIKEFQVVGKEIDVLGLLGTFHRKGVNEAIKCLEELKETFPGKVFNSTIHLNSKLAEAAGMGLPIQLCDRASQGAVDYDAFTEEVILRAGLKSVAQVA